MFYQLPPVGNPICLSVADQPESLLEAVFSPYQARYFASGTAALAAGGGGAGPGPALPLDGGVSGGGCGHGSGI